MPPRLFVFLLCLLVQKSSVGPTNVGHRTIAKLPICQRVCRTCVAKKVEDRRGLSPLLAPPPPQSNRCSLHRRSWPPIVGTTRAHRTVARPRQFPRCQFRSTIGRRLNGAVAVAIGPGSGGLVSSHSRVVWRGPLPGARRCMLSSVLTRQGRRSVVPNKGRKLGNTWEYVKRALPRQNFEFLRLIDVGCQNRALVSSDCAREAHPPSHQSCGGPVRQSWR